MRLSAKPVSYTHLDVYKRQVLSSTKTGAGNDIRVVAEEDGVTTGSNLLTTQNFAPTADPANAGAFLKPDSTSGAGGVITQAKSARLTIDGLQVVRDSNKISDALEGVTLDLLAAQSSTDLADGKTINITAVSYTHLDVYKRQALHAAGLRQLRDG